MLYHPAPPATLCWMPSFSQRLGYAQPPEITVREELPPKLRQPIAQIAARHAGAKVFRQVVDGVLDPYGLLPPTLASIFRNGDIDFSAAVERFNACLWFRVYDVIEAAHRHLTQLDLRNGVIPLKRAPAFERAINQYFVHAGIGWQFVAGEIAIRSDTAFEGTIGAAVQALTTAGRPTAADHIKCARRALSERPKPNTAGAVSQATSAVECVLGEMTGEALTLGKYLDRYPKLFHPALKKALDGIYGYASDAGARHGKEGVEPSRSEATFAVATCAAACTLLTEQTPASANDHE